MSTTITMLQKQSPSARLTVLADSGPLYAAFDPDDQFHQQAQAELTRLGGSGRQVLVTQQTLIETHALILRRLGHRRALEWLAEVLDGVLLLETAPADWEGVLDRLRRYPDQSLSLTDALVASVSEQLQVPVWTYDHHFDVMRVPVWR